MEFTKAFAVWALLLFVAFVFDLHHPVVAIGLVVLGIATAHKAPEPQRRDWFN
jgi:hypothetical protein